MTEILCILWIFSWPITRRQFAVFSVHRPIKCLISRTRARLRSSWLCVCKPKAWPISVRFCSCKLSMRSSTEFITMYWKTKHSVTQCRSRPWRLKRGIRKISHTGLSEPNELLTYLKPDLKYLHRRRNMHNTNLCDNHFLCLTQAMTTIKTLLLDGRIPGLRQ